MFGLRLAFIHLILTQAWTHPFMSQKIEEDESWPARLGSKMWVGFCTGKTVYFHLMFKFKAFFDYHNYLKTIANFEFSSSYANLKIRKVKICNYFYLLF